MNLRGVESRMFAGAFLGVALVSPGPAHSQPATIDLLERFPVARVAMDDASIGDVPIDSVQHFAGGFYQPGEAEDGRLYRWMGPGAGVVDVAMVEAEDLMLTLGLAPPKDDRVPPLKVRFHWNGEFAGAVELTDRAQAVKMKVPAQITRPGLNRLEFFPSFWVDASRLAGGASAANVSVNVFRLSIERMPERAARVLGSRPALRPDGTVLQPGNSVVSYATRVEPGAVLTLSGRWTLDDGGKEPAEAQVVIRSANTDSPVVRRVASTLEAAEFSGTIDLAPFVGEFVEISTIVRQTTPSQTRSRSVVWETLKLKAAAESATGRAAVASDAARPNIVLVVFDTLRADYTEPYGANTVRTPNFTKLASRGTTFTNAFAHSSWTRPSIATMLTSLHETRHGVVTIGHRLPEKLPYLPEILRGAGYRTLCVSMNAHVSRDWRFDRGFDAFHELGAQHEMLLAENLTPEAYVNALWDTYIAPTASDGQPFFLYYHELDPHGPYVPRPPFNAIYPSAYRGQPEIEADHINLVRLGLTELAPQDIAYLETRYRAEVAFIDGVLGAIIDRLERDGLADNTILIVTSDHGEEFGEHGGIGHMVTLYDEVLRVPMIWTWPGHIGAMREPTAAGLIDVAPTLLGLLGLEHPDVMEGRNLAATLTARVPVRDHPIFAHLTGNPARTRRAVHWAGWKLCIRDFGPESFYELVDTGEDPGEVTNRWTAEREAGLALRQALDWYAYTTGGVAAARAENVQMESLDPELVERLRNLGYVE